MRQVPFSDTDAVAEFPLNVAVVEPPDSVTFPLTPPPRAEDAAEFTVAVAEFPLNVAVAESPDSVKSP